MSFPITAVGPLKVLTKPILTGLWARAGPAASAITAPSATDIAFIFHSSLDPRRGGCGCGGTPPPSPDLCFRRGPQAPRGCRQDCRLSPRAALICCLGCAAAHAVYYTSVGRQARRG